MTSHWRHSSSSASILRRPTSASERERVREERVAHACTVGSHKVKSDTKHFDLWLSGEFQTASPPASRGTQFHIGQHPSLSRGRQQTRGDKGGGRGALIVQTAVSSRRVKSDTEHFDLRSSHKFQTASWGRQSHRSPTVARPAPAAGGTHLRHLERQGRHAGPGPVGKEERLLQVSNVRVVASFGEQRLSVVGTKGGSDDYGVDRGAGRRMATVSASVEGFGGIGSTNQLLTCCRSKN